MHASELKKFKGANGIRKPKIKKKKKQASICRFYDSETEKEKSSELDQQLLGEEVEEEEVKESTENSSLQVNKEHMANFEPGQWTEVFKVEHLGNSYFTQEGINHERELREKMKQNRKLFEQKGIAQSEGPDNQFKQLICPICVRLIYKCVSVSCGHNYCEKCLEEYFIFKENCFLCDQKVRGCPIYKSPSNDTLIERLVSSGDAKDPSIRSRKAQFDDQVKEYKIWNLEREVKNLKVGDRVDARDQDYVWSAAVVILAIELADKPNLVCIHFEDWKNVKDEFM